MIIIFFLISISLLVAVGFLFAFLKAVKNGQFDDTTTPAMRILFDEKITADHPAEPTERD